MLYHVLDWGEPLAGSDDGLVLQEKVLGHCTCWLAAGSPDEPLLGASTVGCEGVEGGTTGGRAAATTLGFLAALACWLATGGTEKLLLGASTVGSEGVDGTTTGGRSACPAPAG